MTADSEDTLSPGETRSTDCPMEEQLEGDPLLPGEAPNTPYAEDCEHWIDVYSELIRFADTITGADPLVQRYERRLRFWRDRKGAPPG
jgi:hypothetical protein